MPARTKPTCFSERIVTSQARIVSQWIVQEESVRLRDWMNKLVEYAVVEGSYFWTKCVIFCMTYMYMSDAKYW